MRISAKCKNAVFVHAAARNSSCTLEIIRNNYTASHTTVFVGQRASVIRRYRGEAAMHIAEAIINVSGALTTFP